MHHFSEKSCLKEVIDSLQRLYKYEDYRLQLSTRNYVELTKTSVWALRLNCMTKMFSTQREREKSKLKLGRKKFTCESAPTETVTLYLPILLFVFVHRFGKRSDAYTNWAKDVEVRIYTVFIIV